ncbi:MAG: hypothetical protein ACXVEF_26620 [Polyangiales bacterium]
MRTRHRLLLTASAGVVVLQAMACSSTDDPGGIDAGNVNTDGYVGNTAAPYDTALPDTIDDTAPDATVDGASSDTADAEAG